MKAPSETGLVRDCLQFLAIRCPAAVVWRQNSGATKIGDRFFRSASLNGISDILAVMPPRGRLLAAECKSEKGRLRDSQEEFLARVRAVGGVSGVVRTLDDLDALIVEAMQL
jgi:hypothetical protein